MSTDKDKDSPGQDDNARRRLEEFLRNRAPQPGGVNPAPPEAETVQEHKERTAPKPLQK